jgi:hypothetical protein
VAALQALVAWLDDSPGASPGAQQRVVSPVASQACSQLDWQVGWLVWLQVEVPGASPAAERAVDRWGARAAVAGKSAVDNPADTSRVDDTSNGANTMDRNSHSRNTPNHKRWCDHWCSNKH